MLVLTWNRFYLIWRVGKGFHSLRINLVLFTHCCGVLKWEEVRVSLISSYGDMVSFLWDLPGWWISMVHRWILLDWYSLWWLDSFLFGFPWRHLLVLVLMDILIFVGVFFMHPLLLFHVCGSINCCFLLCSEKCNWQPGC